MHKKNNQGFIVPLVIVAIAVLVIGGFFYFSSKNSNDEVGKEKLAMESGNKLMEGGEADMEKDKAMMDKNSTSTMMKSGSYVPYSADKVSLAGKGPVVLFFRAPWCPTCRALDADIRSHLKDIPENITILDVDYDSSTALKSMYKVTYQHTFVQVDSMGKLITKWSGSSTLSELLTHIK